MDTDAIKGRNILASSSNRNRSDRISELPRLTTSVRLLNSADLREKNAHEVELRDTHLSSADAQPPYRGQRVRHRNGQDLHLRNVNPVHFRQPAACRAQDSERQRFVQDQTVAIPVRQQSFGTWIQNVR